MKVPLKFTVEYMLLKAYTSFCLVDFISGGPGCGSLIPDAVGFSPVSAQPSMAVSLKFTPYSPYSSDIGVCYWYREPMSKLVGEWEIPVKRKVKKWQVSIAIVQLFYLKVFRSYIVWSLLADGSYMLQFIMYTNIYVQTCSWPSCTFDEGLENTPRRPLCRFGKSFGISVLFLSSSSDFLNEAVSKERRGMFSHGDIWNRCAGVVQMWAVWARITFLWCGTWLLPTFPKHIFPFPVGL